MSYQYNWNYTTKICLCGKEFKAISNKHKHCSKYCSGYYKINKKLTQLKCHYKKKYGITIEDYNRLFEEHDGCCAICGRHQTELVRKLHIDHDHNTGKIRGLLCYNCNDGLGRFRDNPELLNKAVEYLQW